MRVEIDGGAVFELGTVEAAPTIGITDYSRRVTDDFGVTTVVERGFSRTMSVRLGVQFDAVDVLQRQLADLRSTPARWIADDTVASLDVRGFYKDFSLDLAVPPLSFCTLTVEGLAEEGTFTDPGGDPAPIGQTSTLRLLQPTLVTGTVLTASTVPETDYPEWSSSTSYDLGARVMRAGANRVYESAVSGNATDDPLAETGTWLDIGPTNRFAMFDQALGTATTANGSISVTLACNTQAVALLDLIAATVRVQATGYDQTLAAGPGSVTFLDLPVNSGAVTVTIAGPGQVSVGTLLIGQIVSLGITEASPTAGITDYSRKAVDDFGEVTVVQRSWAKRMTAKALIRTEAVDLVVNRIAAVRARPCLWIGQAGVDSLIVYGFFKQFSVEIDVGVGKLSLSIEGLSAAATVEPLTVPWENISDPAGTKPDDNATNSADPESAFGRNSTVGLVTTALGKLSANLDVLTPSLFDLAKLAGTINAYMQAKTTLDGKPVGTVVVEVRTVADSAIESLTLLGARNIAGTAWNLSLDTVYVDADTTLAQRFVQLQAYTDDGLSALSSSLSQAITDGDHAAAQRLDTVETTLGGEDGLSAQVSFLQSALVATDGTTLAKAVLSVKANGHVGGLIATNDGTTSSLDLDFDAVRIFKPDGTLLFLAGPAGEVYMPSVRVDTLTAGAINFEFTGDRQLLNPSGWVQELPGGFIMMGGQYRASLADEATISIVFPKPFPLQTLAYGANGFNSNGNNRKDLAPQNTGTPSRFGATFYMQAPNDNAIALDGFDWWAWGR